MPDQTYSQYVLDLYKKRPYTGKNALQEAKRNKTEGCVYEIDDILLVDFASCILYIIILYAKMFFKPPLGVYALKKFDEIYFPHGVVLRSFKKVTKFQYVLQRGPMLSICLGIWYVLREHPRRYRMDLYDPDEPVY